jgi:Spy/CpxP family protein refolding chaperone
MNTAIVTAVSSALLSLLSIVAAPDAGAAAKDGAHGGRRGHGELCEKLACTDAQRAEIDAIRSAVRTETQDERAAMAALKLELRAAKQAAKPDPVVIDGLRAKLKALHATMKSAREQSRTAIEAVLTPAQREQFAAMKAEHAKKHGKGKHGKGKHGKGKHDGKGKHAGKGKRTEGERSGKAERNLAKRANPTAG